MKFSRRQVIAAPALLTLPLGWQSAAARSSSDLQIYYNDDSTDLVTLASPYHKFREDISDKNFNASVDEAVAAGVDVFVIEPGTGWVPLWNSAIYSGADHFKWFSETYKTPIAGIQKFVVEGGDVVATTLAHCRKRGIPLLVSFRLNDVHTIAFSGRSLDYAKNHMEDQALPASERTLPSMMSQIHADHPEWRIDPTSTRPTDMVWNWAHPEAVAHKLALVSELIGKYDFDGIELDFMRYPRFFADDVPASDRTRIMAGFITAVRSALDRKRKGKELSLRVPAKFVGFAPLGLELEKLRDLGVQRLNLSSNTFTNQDVDFQAIRSAAKGLRLTLELAQAKHFDTAVPRAPGSDGLVLATPQDDLTTAYLAQQNGCDSLSLFNFSYYRRNASTGLTGYDNAHEPPFELINRLKKPAQGFCPMQSWFLGTIFPPGLGKMQVPAPIVMGKPVNLTLQLIPPPGGWARAGLFRFIALRKGGAGTDASFGISINGHPVDDKQPPAGFALAEEAGANVRSLAFDTAILKSGANKVGFTMSEGEASLIALVEIFVHCGNSGQ